MQTELAAVGIPPEATIVYEQGQLEGGERAGDRQTEEIALALVPEPADGPIPSQMRQD